MHLCPITSCDQAWRVPLSCKFFEKVIRHGIKSGSCENNKQCKQNKLFITLYFTPWLLLFQFAKRYWHLRIIGIYNRSIITETKTGWDFIHTNLYAKAVCNLKFILLQLQQRIGRTRSFPSVSFQVFTMIRNIIGKHPVNLRCRFEYVEKKNGKNYQLDCFIQFSAQNLLINGLHRSIQNSTEFWIRLWYRFSQQENL